MSLKRILILLIILLVFSSCKQNEENPVSPPAQQQTKTKFQLVFHILNPNDTTLNTVRLETLTYYPDTNMSQYVSKYWDELTYSDTMWVLPPWKGYVGCTRQIAVSIRKIPYRPNYFTRRYVFAVDTIKSVTDSVIVFHWPDDTLKAIYKEKWF